MRLIVLLAVVATLYTGNAVADCLRIGEDKRVIEFKSKLGNVTFAHQKHAGLSITECTTCHHKYLPGDHTMTPCHECHKPKAKEPEPPKTKDAFHIRCIGCHEYTVAGGQHAGPIKKKCKLCHVN